MCWSIRHIREGGLVRGKPHRLVENGMVSGAGAELAEEGYDGLWVADFGGVEAVPARWSIYPWLASFVPAVSPPWA